MKTSLNAGGLWVPDNCTVTKVGEIVGPKPSARIGGFWLGGVAAAYQSWESLVLRYLQGLRDYALTGSEEVLKATINTDQAMPYMSRHLTEGRNTATSVEDRANNQLQRYVVPPETRCLVAGVDVQGGTGARFVVQVHAVGPHMEQWLVDRFEIRQSMREGMGAEFAPIDPAAYAEDWETLTNKLLRSTWRTPDEGLELRLKLVVVDTGGEDGTTPNAYQWFRKVRREGLADKVMLYKGASVLSAPVLKLTRVGKRGSKDKGDVPLYVCNPNVLSDGVDSGLRRQTPGPGYIHFPAPKHPTQNPDGWLPPAFFDELKAEVRQSNGTWAKIRKRNESFDLCRMIRAGMLRLGLDKIRDWSSVPAWLAPLAQNSEIMSATDRRVMKEDEAVEIEEPKAAEVVRVVTRQKKPRRSVASPYIR
jgi:phage terminase large subunit GpA-like protein